MNPYCPSNGRVLATADVRTEHPEAAARRLSRVYADPVAWLLAELVDSALAKTDPLTRKAETGVILSAPHPTRHTVRTISRAGAAVSPMKFAAAGPGAPIGTVCAVFGFRGPALVLPMPTDPAIVAVRAVAEEWLAIVTNVVVLTHLATTVHQAHCTVLTNVEEHP